MRVRLRAAVIGAVAALLPTAPASATSPASATIAASALVSASAQTGVSPQDDPRFARGLTGAGLRLRQLDGVKRVLMIAAHPDDEDTALLATLARGLGAQVAYLSLTRGEGGQNLIGSRLHEGLGLVRTGELLSARSVDGAAQYFTRAFDYGYSKTLDEALSMWPHDEILRDVVHVVRSFRPQVIVSVFSGTPRDGHGQHQFAGVMAGEAFAAAGDPARFPELGRHGIESWQPTRLYRLNRFGPNDATLVLQTGAFDPLLGRSHFQLAMESRSRHRSQDMGAGQPPGPRSSRLRLVDSAVEGWEGEEDDGLFAAVDTTLAGALHALAPAGWPGDLASRVESYRSAVANAGASLSALEPEAAAGPLLRAAAILGELADAAPPGPARDLLERRRANLSEAVLAAAAVVADIRVGRDLIVPGESVAVDVTVWSGGGFALSAVRPELLLPPGWAATPTDESAAPPGRSPFFREPAIATPDDGRVGAGGVGRWSWRVAVPEDAEPSTAWYLREERDGALHRWPDDPALWGLPATPSPIRARVGLALGRTGDDGPDVALAVEREGAFVGVDGAVGEYRRSVLVVPAVNVEVDPPWMVWPSGSGGVRAVGVALTNASTNAQSGWVRLEAPESWRVAPDSVAFELAAGQASGSTAFEVAAPEAVPNGVHRIRAVAHTATTEFRSSFDIIDHPHIPRALMAREAAVETAVFPVAANPDLRVGYLMGSGDDGATALRQLGMTVEDLDEERVRSGDFTGLDAIVLGIRAYETRPDLVAANAALLDFARGGGTVVVQYNRYGFPGGGFAPFPVSMNRPHDRVTDENAEVALLAPRAPVFTAPNALQPADFDGWVQERGLYFLSEWDERYTPVMAMADPGEAPKEGALLVAEVGDGLYIYTGLALFRQLPALVPGAYRLLANLVSLNADDWRRWRVVH